MAAPDGNSPGQRLNLKLVPCSPWPLLAVSRKSKGQILRLLLLAAPGLVATPKG